MKKLILILCSCITAAALHAQIKRMPSENPAYPVELNRTFFNANSTAEDCYKSELCMSSVNIETFNEFMLWVMNKIHWPGMQVSILHEGELIWKNNYGLANIGQAKQVTDSTVFRLFSVSKTMVATSMMMLYERGLIDLNGRINDYLPFPVVNPWYPFSNISPKMVLTHSASLSDNCPGSGPACDLVEYYGDPQVSLHDYLESHFVPGGICYGNSSYLNYAPGTYCLYSNPGAALGGYIVESVSGMGFNEFCNDSIFAPLDMPGSRWFYSELDTTKVAMIYTWNGNAFLPYGFRSWVGYPEAELKSNVTELSNFLEMYLNHGKYNGTRILDSVSVDLITTVYDTITAWNYPLGLIWQYWFPYNVWFHDGARGASINFNKEENKGCAIVGNGEQWEYEPVLAATHFMATYSDFAVSDIQITDDDGDGILENGETIIIRTGIFNNLMNAAENVSVTLKCNDPVYQLCDSVASLGNISSGQGAINQGQPFKLLVSQIQTPHCVMMDLKINYNSDQSETIHFPLFAGQADILLVKDELDVLNSERFYLDVLDSLGYSTKYWDIAVYGNPGIAFLKNFPVVIWYTGYDEDSTVNESNQNALINYLDNGGRVFMTGQNISDDIASSEFMSEYMHTDHVSNTTFLQINGINGDTLSSGLSFLINNSDGGINNQYSQSVISPENGGEPCLLYNGISSYTAGIRYENDTYKTVFLGFGFEAIGEFQSRYDLLKGILAYFDVIACIDEESSVVICQSSVVCYPNPFIDFTTFEYELEETGIVTLKLLNDLGQVVAVLLNEQQNKGIHHVLWKAESFPAGVYYCQLQTKTQVMVEKIIKSK